MSPQEAPRPKPRPLVSPATSSFRTNSSNSVPKQVIVDGYKTRVSFDERTNGSNANFSLQATSAIFVPTATRRALLCFISCVAGDSPCQTLDWCLRELVEDGDELVVCRIDNGASKGPQYCAEERARLLMRQVQKRATQHEPTFQLSLVVEITSGKIADVLDRLVALYRPDSIIVGATLRRAWHGMSNEMDSVSKCCLTLSPVPIIVVRSPESTQGKSRAGRLKPSHFGTGA